MSEKDDIEAMAQQIAEMEHLLDEAEAALDIEARARAAGLDYAAARKQIKALAAGASPQAVAEAKRRLAEQDAQEKAARAEAVKAMSRTASAGATAPVRRPRNMA